MKKEKHLNREPFDPEFDPDLDESELDFDTDVPKQISGREPAPCEAGSIEQQLDMCEHGELKGDLVLGRRNQISHDPDEAIEDANEMMSNYRMNMAETNREGDESSGDEHSSGLQGGEPELKDQEQIDTGMPGDRTDHEQIEVEKRKRRIA